MSISAVFVDVDTFTVEGDQTLIFHVGRRVRADCGVDLLKYGTINSVSFDGTNTTTVDLTAASDNLTSNLTTVLFGIVGKGVTQSMPDHVHDTTEGAGGELDKLYFGGNTKIEALTGGSKTTGDHEATTSLTVGGTVITDGLITGDGAIIIRPASYHQIWHPTVDTDTTMYIGNIDASRGLLILGSDNTGAGAGGGTISLHVAEDQDGNGTDSFTISVYNDDLTIGADNDPDMLKFRGGATPDIVSTVNFTVLNGAFGVGTGDAVPAIVNLYSDNASDGPKIQMFVGPDSDGDGTTYFRFDIVTDDLWIGPDNDPDAFKIIGGGTVSAEFTVGLTGTTIDATTDFTVGGLVITNGVITDDGTLLIVPAAGCQVRGDGNFSVGEPDVQRGVIRAYGHATGTAAGGELRLYTSFDHDTDIDYFSMQISQDDFYFGPNTDTDAFKFIGNGAAVTAEFTVGLTGTTIDASTDFTVGGTVITDGQIADDGSLLLVPTTDVKIQGSGILEVGSNDSQSGLIRVYGHATGSTIGGKIQLNTAFDHDTVINSYTISIVNDDLLIGPDTDSDALVLTNNKDLFVTDGDFYVRNPSDDVAQLYIGQSGQHRGAITIYGDNTGTGSGGIFALHLADDYDTNISDYRFQASNDDLLIGPDTDLDAFKLVGNGAAVTAEFTVGLTGTTIDAGTDFTVGGTVITDGNIADTGVFTLNAVSGVSITGDGRLHVGVNNSLYGDIRVYGNTSSSSTGGQILFYTANDYDTDIDYFSIAGYQDDFRIGSDTDPDAFKLVGNGAAVTAEFTVGLTGTTIDAGTDFTVGGTVITDNTITDDGTLDIVATIVDFTTGSVGIGVVNTQYGDLTLYSNASTQGGIARFKLADDSNDNIDRYEINVTNDDLQIGPNTDPDSLKYTGGDGYWRFTSGLATFGTVDANRAVVYFYATATTGPILVLETPGDYDDTITNYQINVSQDKLLIGPSTNPAFLTFQGPNRQLVITDGDLVLYNSTDDRTFVYCGVAGTAAGTFVGRGGLTGVPDGGKLQLDTADDYDTTINAYTIQANQDDLIIGPNTDVDLLTINANKDVFITDGDLYIRNPSDDRGFLFVGQAGSHRGVIYIYGENTGSGTGATLGLFTADDYDTDIGTYFFQISQDDLLIGPDTDPDAFKLVGNGAAVTAEFTVGLTGTTIDAGTDFTVGGTVITDGTITDDGNLSIVPTSQVTIDGAGRLEVGKAALRGDFRIHGSAAGNANGGSFIIYTADEYDDTITHYQIQAIADNFYIGPSTDTDSLSYDGGDNKWIFSGANGVDIVNALTADTIDADTDFTVGGTVITDGDITDDGFFYITPTTKVVIRGGSILEIGTNDSQFGSLHLFGHSNNTGGHLRWYTGATGDTDIDYYTIKASSDDLLIGPTTDPDAFKLVGNGAAVTAEFTVGLTGTTIDAGTDFTVGGTVITSGGITDDGVFTITPTTSLVLAGTGTVYVGQNDVVRGTIVLYGPSGSANGGSLHFYNAADVDGSEEYYSIFTDANGSFNIGPISDTNSLFHNDATGQWSFTGAAGLDVVNALTADTIDADTDFTVGGTVITDNTITDDGQLAIVTENGTKFTDPTANDSSFVYIGDQDTQAGILWLYGHKTGSAQGGKIALETAADHDGTTQRYTFDVVEDDLLIGTEDDVDMLVFTAGTTINATVGFIGTTIDAGTDFTVGGTVITDATITDDGTLDIVANGVQIKHGTGASDAQLAVGQDDVQRGFIIVYGDATGDNSGGGLYLRTSFDHDTNIDEYRITVESDDLQIGPDTNPDAFKLVGNGAAVTAEFTVPLTVSGLWADVRGRFIYKDANEVYINAAAYYHDGTTKQLVYWDSQLTKTVTSTIGWNYLYINDSAVVTLGTNLLTATELLFSTTVPTWSDAKHGWYSGSDRCIFATYCTGVSVQQQFVHDGDYVVFGGAVNSYSGAPGTSWGTKATLRMPAFTRKAHCSFDMRYVNTTFSHFFWRPVMATTGSHNIGRVEPNSNSDSNSAVVITDSSLQIALYADGANTITVYTNGWYFPEGM